MNKDYKVLIVDDEAEIGTVISNLLSKISLSSVYVSNAKEALEIIKNSTNPFALIISDQRMPGMSGTEFFEQVSMVAPETIRFMITGYADIQSMIDAVNRGEVHKYITKPWKNEDFLACIKEGLRQYELTMENIRLFNLAKEQNTKLVELSRMLNASAAKQAKRLEELDVKIAEELKRKNSTEGKIIVQRSDRAEQDIYPALKRVKELIREVGLIDYERMNKFYGVLLSELSNRLKI